MWMFLEPYAVFDPPKSEPDAPQGCDRADTAAAAAAAAEAADLEPRAMAVAGAPTRGVRGAYLPANGCPPHVVRNADTSAPATVRLYIHPGRVLIGEMSAERVAGQLDMARAVLFESVGAAELAADEGAGFLVEVCEPFRDAEGRRCESGCYFLGRLC